MAPASKIEEPMSVLETKLNSRSADFQANVAATKALVDDLQVQLAHAAAAAQLLAHRQATQSFLTTTPSR